MRRVLFGVIQLLLFAAYANAQSTAMIVEEFGLLGKWAIECSRPPSPRNEHALFALTSAGVWVFNDFGPDYDGMVYRVVDAERDAPDKLLLRQVLATDDTVVLVIVMLKSNDKIRVWSSRTADGNVLVKDGTIASASDQATRWAGRCDRRAGPPNSGVQ